MFTWVEVKKSAINHNLSAFQRLIGKKVKIMPVIKANAYGHGFLPVARVCDQNKNVFRLCVVNSDEAKELMAAKIKTPIQILSFYDLDEAILKPLIKHGVIFPLYSLEQAKKLNQTAEKLKRAVKIHLKIDSGATRTGIAPTEIKKFVSALKKFQRLNIEGVWSHFASSESDPKYTNFQRKNFSNACRILKQEGITPPLAHISCSAAAAVYPKNNLDAIRLGLGLYGLYPTEDIGKKLRLRPALAWHTKIIQIKIIAAGTKIGYGCSFTAAKRSKIAVLPIGYWDGYDRSLSNKSQVIINGRRCPVRGRICMNLTMVELPLNSKAKIGTKATLIGRNGNVAISVNQLAKLADTINYELVDRINPLIPRLIK